MKRFLRLLCVSVTLIFGYVGTALAEDFTFTVPVNLKALISGIFEGRVECYVVDTAAPSEKIGTANANFAIPADGNVSQNIVVKFNAAQGKNPASANRGFCVLWLHREGYTWHRVNQSESKQGTEFHGVRAVDLPQ